MIERVSQILLCKYAAAHVNVMKKRYARRAFDMLTVKREVGAEYTEANMGSGEARLYLVVTALEATPVKSLILLEEPETALHPSAQFELGKYLVEVAKRRKLQILMTTHSEYVLLALPEESRVFLKREGTGVVPIPRIGVRQAVSMMDSLAIPSIYILVEDEIAGAVVTELLRMHDADFLKTARVFAAGDKDRIAQMMDVFKDQRIPICAVRDGDCGENVRLQLFKLFGTEPPEKEIFKSPTFRQRFSESLNVDWGAADIANRDRDHHQWFDVLETQTRLNRGELIAVAARAYLEGVPKAERKALVEKIKASSP